MLVPIPHSYKYWQKNRGPGQPKPSRKLGLNDPNAIFTEIVLVADVDTMACVEDCDQILIASAAKEEEEGWEENGNVSTISKPNTNV